MASQNFTLTDASPDGAAFTLTLAEPVATIEDLQNGDQVAMHLEMDGSTTATTASPIAHIFRRNESIHLEGLKVGHSVLFSLNPFGADTSRSVSAKVEKA